jgi:hypothetical protein
MVASPKKHTTLSLLVVLIGLSGQGLMAASFDCTIAATSTEKAICSDHLLSALDSTMGRRYYAIRDKRMRKLQREWIKNRNKACGGNVACLKRWIKRRIISFENKPTHSAIKRSSRHEHFNSGYVFSPEHGVICDKKSNFCVDAYGISMGLTKEYLGKKAVETLRQMTKELKDMDMKSYTLSSGLSCDSDKRICKRNKWDTKSDTHWTHVLYGEFSR